MDLFRAADDLRGLKDLIPKISSPYPTMMKLATAIFYLKKIQKKSSHTSL